MSNQNKKIRKRLIQKYGNICMMEEAGIRKIPLSERKKIKGYKSSQEMITYHHIKPVREKGRTTEENGALLKEYNHEWLERQDQSVRNDINEKLQQFKLNFSGISLGDGLETKFSCSVDLDFNFDDYIVIPVYETKQKPKGKDKIKKPTRAEIKQETQQMVNEYYESIENTTDEGFFR